MVRLSRTVASVLLVCVFLWALGTWRAWHTPNTVPATANAQQSTGHVKLAFVATNEMWLGKPIFKVTNASGGTLHHVTIMSWTNELLPVLHIGSHAPSHWPMQSEEIAKGPFNLLPNESLWFVGPSDSTPHFVFNWLANGKEPKFQVIETEMVGNNE